MTASSIVLPAAGEHELVRLARAGLPNEACGLLLGRRAAARTEVVLVLGARNLERERPHERFELDPADHLRAEEHARRLGLAVVGVWHTHPFGAAQPSAADRATAWSGWSHVIVALDAHRADVRSFRFTGTDFVEEELARGLSTVADGARMSPR